MDDNERKVSGNAARFSEPNEDLWLPVGGQNETVQTAIDDIGSSSATVKEHDEIVDSSPTRFDFLQNPTGLERWRFKAELKLTRISEWLKHEIQYELELGIGFLLIPVLFGIGCIIYFNLPREPLIGAFAVAAIIGLGLAYKSQAGGILRPLLSALCILAAGAAVAQLQTHLLKTKTLSTTIFADVTGVIEKVEIRPNGSHRYTLNTSEHSGSVSVRNKKYDVERVRLTARESAPVFHLNQTITGRARVGPASGPAYPGGYDFGFQNWFNGIGGSGFFLGSPKAAVQQIEVAFSFRASIAHMRDSVGNIIRSSLKGDAGGLAAALIVGDRSGISETVSEDLRKSGLAHILAISGLHMALISATVILGLRAMCSFIPSIALHKPVKKWASAAALCVSAIYLLLSGAGVSTQRAFIMISIMLLAVLFDRRALTMRNVAIAALVVLIIAPQAVLSPGFQMSFSAVAALIASYEALKRRRERKQAQKDNKAVGRIQKWVVRDIGGLAMTSVIAGAATGLFAAYHFQRVATLGLVANVLAMPLVSLMVMPFALLSVVAMPFGLEAYPLYWMSAAIEPVTAIAKWVANMGLVGNTGVIAVSTLLMGSLAIVVITIFQSRLRLVAFSFVPVAVYLTVSIPEPDILVLENGQQIAVRDSNGTLQILRPNAEKFNTEIWLKAYSPNGSIQFAETKRPRFNPYYSCDEYGCSKTINAKTVTWLKSTAQLQRDCRQSDILVIPFTVQNACTFLDGSMRPLVIESNRLKALGSHAIYLAPNTDNDQNAIVVKTAFVRNNRPWLIHKN